MKNKGFTLSELLVCLAIFAILMVVAIPSIMHAINRNKEAQYQMFIDEILASTEEYILENRNSFTTTICNPNCVVNVSTLVNLGKIDGDIENPKTGEKLSGSSGVVLVETDGENFDLSYEEDYQQ